jgi:hypothetical protein
LGMPVQGTPERVTLWATGGRVLMQPQAAGAGGGGSGRIERDFGWQSGYSLAKKG